jgi:hypothetical protein
VLSKLITKTINAMEYKGWLISPETDPWSLKHKNKFKATNDGKVLTSDSIKDLIAQINERSND